tara:strand:+ start:21 stop:467 length:447 start_codon:yes stop_codon:yes gene_type:complete
MIKYILNLFASDRLAGGDDRNAVIELLGQPSKTKSSHQKVCSERVGSAITFLSAEDSVKYSAVALNSLSNLVKSRLGIIRFLATGEMGDLSTKQMAELFDEIDNQVEKLEDDVNNYIKESGRLSKQTQENSRMHRQRISDNFDDFKEV